MTGFGNGAGLCDGVWLCNGVWSGKGLSCCLGQVKGLD